MKVTSRRRPQRYKMDPALFSLPEVILNDGGESDCAQPGSLPCSPAYHQPIPASQEGADVRKPSNQKSCGPACPSKPPSVVAQMLRRRANPDQRADAPSQMHLGGLNQKRVQRLIPGMAGPIHPHAQDCSSYVNILPGVCPPSLPGLAPVVPEFMFAPCSPPDSCWLSPVTSTPNANPCVLVATSSTPQFCCCRPCSWMLVPEVNRCMCHQAVLVHQPCGPDLVSRRAASVQLNVTPERAVSGTEQAKPEESLAEHTFDAYLPIMDTLSPKAEQTLSTQYLDTLLSSGPEPIDPAPEKQEQEVGSHLDPVLSAHPDPIELLSEKELLLEILQVVQQKLAQLSSADRDDVTPVTVEASAPLQDATAAILDPPDTTTTNDGQKTPQGNTGPGSWTTCSPLLPSILLEDKQPADATLNYSNLVNATPPLNHDGFLFMSSSPDTSLTSDVELGGNHALVDIFAVTGEEPEEASAFLKATDLLETREGLLVSEGLASSELGEDGKDVGAAATTKARKKRTTKGSFERKEAGHGQRPSGPIEMEGLIIERAGERQPGKKSAKKTGPKQLCKIKESNFEERSRANTAEQFPEIGGEQQRELKVEGGERREADGPNVSAESGAENTPLTTAPQQEGVQIVRRRTRAEQTPLAATRGRSKAREIQNDSKLPAQERRDLNTTETQIDESINAAGDGPLGETGGAKLTSPLSLKSQNMYSLRSQNVPQRTEQNKATHQLTAGVKGEGNRISGGEAGRQSPMKRHRGEAKVEEAEAIGLSPMKRGRWKSRAEAEGGECEGGEAGTPGREPSSPSVSSSTKATSSSEETDTVTPKV